MKASEKKNSFKRFIPRVNLARVETVNVFEEYASVRVYGKAREQRFELFQHIVRQHLLAKRGGTFEIVVWGVALSYANSTA